MELHLLQRIPPLSITLSDWSLDPTCLPNFSAERQYSPIARNYAYDKPFSVLIPGLERLYPSAYLNSVLADRFILATASWLLVFLTLCICLVWIVNRFIRCRFILGENCLNLSAANAKLGFVHSYQYFLTELGSRTKRLRRHTKFATRETWSRTNYRQYRRPNADIPRYVVTILVKKQFLKHRKVQESRLYCRSARVTRYRWICAIGWSRCAFSGFCLVL